VRRAAEAGVENDAERVACWSGRLNLRRRNLGEWI
jgi:hypothetical protein